MNKFIDKIPFKRKGLIYISVAALLWSSSGLFIKISGQLNLDAFQISFYRSLVAAITIISISTFQKKKIRFEFDTISILCSVTYAGILIFFVIANTLTTAANTIFLQFTAPIYLLFLEPLFLKTKFQMRNLITVIVCIIGMSLFFMGKLETGNLYGNMFGIFSGISFALFSLFLKWKKQIHKTENTLSQIAMGNILVAVICFPVIFSKLIISPLGFIILTFLGIFQIGISYIIYNEGIKYVSATESLIIAMLETVFNPFWVYLGIGEKPSNYALLGGAVILVGIVAHNFIIKEKPEEKIYPEAG